MTEQLTKLEYAYFETLDLLGRLKLGASNEAKTTDKGVAFVDDCFELLCNILAYDDKCFHKMCEFYRSIQSSLPVGADLTEEALATKQLVCAVFKSQKL